MARFKRILLGMTAAALVLAPIAAQASIRDTVSDLLGQLAEVAHPDAVAPAPSARPAAAHVKMLDDSVLQSSSLSEYNVPALPSQAVAEMPTPSIEKPLKKIFCVEYARARSGLAVFGDAKFWWSHAKNLYARLSTPVEEAVMVFTADRKLRSGHVAVVTNIISDREIRVDQANWQNHGEIDRSTPIRDVSANNDWTKVRVWDMRSQTFGSHIYSISGFLAKELTRQASN
jgi:hypothetical protein